MNMYSDRRKNRLNNAMLLIKPNELQQSDTCLGNTCCCSAGRQHRQACDEYSQ